MNMDKKLIFLGVMGTPYQSELITSLFRIVQEALHQGHEIIVWTCGYATQLTQATVIRRPNMFDRGTALEDTHYFATTELVKSLFDFGEERLDWYVCNYCSEERGATDQIAEVKVKVPWTFNYYLNLADVSMVLGVKS